MNEQIAVDLIAETKRHLAAARRVFVLTGAGISAESGVPTFRGGGNAVMWRGMPFEELSSAKMVRQNLPLIWEWFDYRRSIVGECEPNQAHKTLAAVGQNNQFEQFTLVTQNIDGLHRQAGSQNAIELHGSIWRAKCVSCEQRQDLRDVAAERRPPVCPKCNGLMRPDVILFGEAMPLRAVEAAQTAASKADICIVVGTSALVYPAANLPVIAKQNGALIIEINPEETALTAVAAVSLRGKAAEILPAIFAALFEPEVK